MDVLHWLAILNDVREHLINQGNAVSNIVKITQLLLVILNVLHIWQVV